MIATRRWSLFAALGAAGAVLISVLAPGSANAAPAAPPAAAATTLCGLDTTTVANGEYVVQNNEWGSDANECISTDGNTGFTVVNSEISNATSGAPGGYPSIFKGCHWGQCTEDSGLPVQVSAMHTGSVTSNWSTTQPGNGAYDVAYDLWYNTQPTTTGQPDGAELMIWLNHNGSVQPFGTKVVTTTIDGVSYDVWFGTQGWNTVSYSRTSPATSVSNLDIYALTADAVNRGYIQPSWYLIDVEAGFELWQGGAGLATNSFSVSVNP